MHSLIERLEQDRDTRQGVVTVWDNELDQSDVVFKDMPCTTYFNFTVREEMLHMTTHMRSNDVWRGWSYDAFQFMQLGFTVANYLDVSMGPYVHVVDSMHMYEDDMEAFGVLSDVSARTPRPHITGLDSLGEESWKAVQEIATDIFYAQDAKGYTSSEEWMINTGIAKVVHGSV
jgi:thymidylate synthase